MVVVFAVLGAGLRVEEIITSNELKGLCDERSVIRQGKLVLIVVGSQTIAAILQTSVLAPHLDPKITSGDRYCLVWMSFVKW